MPFLRSGFRALVPAAITTALCGTLLSAPPAGAAEQPAPTIAEAAEAAVEAPSRVDAGSDQPTDRFIVKFEEGTDAPAGRGNAFGKVASKLGITVEEVRAAADGAVIVEAAEEVPAGTVDDVVTVLNAQPNVEYAEPDLIVRPLATVNDPGYPEQWNLHEAAAGLRVPGAWDRSTGMRQTIAVLDTGITSHSDLNRNVLPGYDFVADPGMAVDGNGRDSDASDPGDACADPAEPSDSSWHGTHVAGIAAAEANNARGVAGVAHNAVILPLRVMGACGGHVSDTAAAVRWAAGGAVSGVPANLSPARVINLSLGTEGTCGSTMQSAIDFAVARGSVVIAAAGNEAQQTANVSPANCRNVVTVAATGRAGDSASYSNFGPEVDVSAPGGDGNLAENNILSTLNTGETTPGTETYAFMQGTSMAAPHVAGVAALMLSANPTLSSAQVEQLLRNTARPLPGSCFGGCGTGLVDANAAVAAAATGFSPSLRSEADVVAADSAGTLWSYPANGRGGFLPRVRLGSGWASLKSGFATDWNQDGVLDLLAQWKDGRLTVYRGKRDGGFQPAQAIGNGWGSYFVTVGKWRTTDAYPGIVASDGSGRLWHYPNPAGSTLGPRTTIGSGWQGLYLTMTDFDGDARMDLIAKRSDGALIEYRSNGAGSFVNESRRTVGSGWQGINSMTDLPGFARTGTQGVLTRLTDGRLAYYPFARGRWGASSIVGSGWGSFNIFR